MRSALFVQQQMAGSALGMPPAIYDFSDAAYLKDVITTWPTCAPVASAPRAQNTSINLETQAAKAHPEACLALPNTPLADINQGSSNTCSSMAFSQAYTVKFALQYPVPATVPQLSPVYAYYLQRVEECTTTGVCPCTACRAPTCTNKCDPPCVDCGSYLESAATIFRKGVCTSASWPLTVPLNTPPSSGARASALYRIDGFQCLPVGDAFNQSVLASLNSGNPVVLFINLTDASTKWLQSLVAWPGVDLFTPAVAIPNVDSVQVTAGHVVAITGYNAQANVFIVRNSFGFNWGVDGQCNIPWDRMGPPLAHSAVAITSVLYREA